MVDELNCETQDSNNTLCNCYATIHGKRLPVTREVYKELYPGQSDEGFYRVIFKNLIKDSEDKHMRVLTGWSKEEREELGNLKNISKSSMDAIEEIYSTYWNCEDDAYPALYHKFGYSNISELNQMAKDIADYFTGDAKFPEKKYYVKLFKKTEGYLTFDFANEEYILSSKLQCDGYQTKFTEQEINDIDPRYMQFAVEVEAD